MRIDTIEELADVLTQSGLTSLEVESNSWSLALERSASSVARVQPQCVAAVPTVSTPSLDRPRQPVADTFVEAAVVGVFHEATPPAFIGQAVRSGDLVGTIDALSIRNDVRAPVDGVILAVDVEDGQPVEYGQVMFELKESVVA